MYVPCAVRGRPESGRLFCVFPAFAFRKGGGVSGVYFGNGDLCRAGIRDGETLRPGAQGIAGRSGPIPDRRASGDSGLRNVRVSSFFRGRAIPGAEEGICRGGPAAGGLSDALLNAGFRFGLRPNLARKMKTDFSLRALAGSSVLRPAGRNYSGRPAVSSS